MKVLQVLSERKTKAGYIQKKEIWDDSEYGGDGKLEVKNAYTPNGDWIGDYREARFLCVKKGLTSLQKSHPNHCCCSIGFNEKEQKWYGWSHRAICGFGIGDKIFTQRFGNDKTKFVKHGKVTIKKLHQAKLAAKRFADYVS